MGYNHPVVSGRDSGLSDAFPGSRTMAYKSDYITEPMHAGTSESTISFWISLSYESPFQTNKS